MRQKKFVRNLQVSSLGALVAWRWLFISTLPFSIRQQYPLPRRASSSLHEIGESMLMRQIVMLGLAIWLIFGGPCVGFCAQQSVQTGSPSSQPYEPQKVATSRIDAQFGDQDIQDGQSEEDEEEEEMDFSSLPNIPWKTLGGQQFWSDLLHFHDWRIQQNVMTKHCRLIDGNSTRHAWGNFDACRDKLNQIKIDKRLPEMDGKAIIVLHGLGGTRIRMKPLSQKLQDQGYTVFNVSYASTRLEMTEHAERLHFLVKNLEGIDEINFVCHSMGNILVRHYLHHFGRDESPNLPDPRIKRMVMLGPPNNGAQFAASFKNSLTFKAIVGKSAQQLGEKWDDLAKQLATPPFEFGIIAGSVERFANPLIEGEGDLFVSIEETKLVGARDFALVKVSHTSLPKDDEVAGLVIHFLAEGNFRGESERQAILTVDPTEKPKANDESGAAESKGCSNETARERVASESPAK
jgi:pimeloyl-ACP methyl ester carboxylesterase